MLRLYFDVIWNLKVLLDLGLCSSCSLGLPSLFLPSLVCRKECPFRSDCFPTVGEECSIGLQIDLSLSLSVQRTGILLSVGLFSGRVKFLSKQSNDLGTPLPEESGLFVEYIFDNFIYFVELSTVVKLMQEDSEQKSG